MKNALVFFWPDEGQDLVEYGLLLVLLSLSAIAGMQGFATAINSSFTNAAANLSAAS